MYNSLPSESLNRDSSVSTILLSVLLVACALAMMLRLKQGTDVPGCVACLQQ
jgi:hypothetical protein